MDTQAALNAGMILGEIRKIGERPFVVVPQDAKVADLENYLLAPTRKRGSTTLTDVASFIAFVSAEKTPETRIYGNLDNPHFTAVFNDHGKSGPGWRDHIAKYACPLSPEWLIWIGHSGKHKTQVDFAQFIEDNLPDIVEPAGAEMLEISRSLEAKKSVNFASGVRLTNGANELTYEETISGAAQKGKLQVPEGFVIGIPVLQGGDSYRVEARLRYRIGDGGKMTMWYELVRPHKIVEDAIKNIRAEIKTGTELDVLSGGLN